MEILAPSLLLALLSCCLVMAATSDVTISRHHLGDMFSFQDSSSCSNEVCSSRSAGTGQIFRMTPRGGCQCQCLPNLATYRDDLNQCVNDFSECALSPFVSGSIFQKIPFVFLPLKGQIIHPSAEILVEDINSPLCVVSKSRFLTAAGWIEIGNHSADFETPFKLHKDHNQVYLKWMGDTELRHEMEGRLVLVNLMCKTKETKISMTPCIAFRVAGSPTIKEVVFSSEISPTLTEASSSIWDYISLGSIAVLLGLIYVTSVALYLYNKKRNSSAPGGEEKQFGGPNGGLGEKTGPIVEVKDERSGRTIPEEGMIKSNPLLHHCHDNGGYVSDEFTNDSDEQDEMDNMDRPSTMNHFQLTSAIIHPSHPDDLYSTEHYQSQDPLSNEKLPEENVSIIETMEKDEASPTVRAMACGPPRRKLYFNPAYFEPDLLIQPPAAAIEFLIKIREVIAIAKQKMCVKKYLPSLINIPEEETLVIPKPSIRPSDTFETSTYERYQSGNNNLNPPSKINVDELNFQFFDHDNINSGKECFYSNNEPNCLINEQNNEFIYNKYRQDWNYNKDLDNEELRSNTSYKDEMLSHRSNRSNKQDTIRSNHSHREELDRNYKDENRSNASYRDEVKSNCSHRSYRDEVRSHCSHRSNRDDARSNCSYKDEMRSHRDELKSNHSYKDELLSQRHELRSNCSHRSNRDREDVRSNYSYKDDMQSVRSHKSQLDEVRSNVSGRSRVQQTQCDDTRSLNHTSCNSFKCNCQCSKQRLGSNVKQKCPSEFSYNFHAKQEDKCKLPSSRKSTHSEMITHDKESVQSFRSMCHNDKCNRRKAVPLSTPIAKPAVPVVHTKQDSIHKWLQNINVNGNQTVDIKDEIDESIETKSFIKPTRNKEKFSNYKKQKAPSPPKQIQAMKTKDMCTIDIEDNSQKSNDTLDRKLDSRHSQVFRGRGEMNGHNSNDEEDNDEDGQIYEDNTQFNKKVQSSLENITKSKDQSESVQMRTKQDCDKTKQINRLPNFSLLHRTNSMNSTANKSDILETSSNKSNHSKNQISKPANLTNGSPLAPKLPNFKLNKSQLHSMMKNLGSLGKNNLDQDVDCDSLEKSLYEQQIYQESESIRTPSDYDDIVKDITAIPAIRKHFNSLQYDEHDYEIVGNKSAEGKELPIPSAMETAAQLMQDKSLQSKEERSVEGEEAPPKAGMEEFAKHNEGYSLISEIYINDTYNIHSSLTNSTSSLSDTTDQSNEKQSSGEDQRIKINAHEGHLTIELEDDPKDYPIVMETFEPDTLDRKDLNNNRHDATDVNSVSDIYMDSLERTPMNTKRLVRNNLKTLRNIFELNSKMLGGQDEGPVVAKQFNGSDVPPPNSLLSYNFIPKPTLDIHSDEEGGGGGSDTDYSQLSWCTTSEKQSKFTKRQRPPSPPLSSPPQPLTPPKLPPRNNAQHDYYEFSIPSKNPIPEIVPPLPPRSIKPPLPPKNLHRRSTDLRKFMNRPLPDLPEDTGGASVIPTGEKQEIYVAVDEMTDDKVGQKTNSVLEPSRLKCSEMLVEQTESDNIYNEIKSDVLSPSASSGFEFDNQKNLTPFEIFQLKRNRKLVRKPSGENQPVGGVVRAMQKEIDDRARNKDNTVKPGSPLELNRKSQVKQIPEVFLREQMSKVLQQINAKGCTFEKPSQNKNETTEDTSNEQIDQEEPYYNVRKSPIQNLTFNRGSKLKINNNEVANGAESNTKESNNVNGGKVDSVVNRLVKHRSGSTPSSPASSFSEFYENKAFSSGKPRPPTAGLKTFRKLSESSEYEFILPRNRHESNGIIRHKSKHSVHNLKPNNDSGYLSTSTSSGSETDDNLNLDSDFSNDNESTSTNFQFYKN